jgi:hypothetical protein
LAKAHGHIGQRRYSKKITKSINSENQIGKSKILKKPNPMKKILLALAITAGLTSFAGSVRASLVFTPVEVNYPGADATYLYGLSGGAFYGGYLENGSYKGFVDNKGTFTTVNPPNAVYGSGVVGVSSGSIIAASLH